MFLVIDARSSRSRRCERRLWRHLWEMRDVAAVNIVMPAVVSSPCPLLAEEPADAVLASGMRVPRDSAWITLHLDIDRFVTHTGDIHMTALEAALTDCVERGDVLHDLRRWPIPHMRFDSWLNRRLSIAIRGWGSLVKKRGDDPAKLETLTELEELAEFISKTLRMRSRELARKKGYCPAVDAAGASVLANGGEMTTRWRRAVESTALRHRNLLTMSVWDVFPQCEPADLRYADLLPLLRCANSLSFRRSVDVSHWDVDHYRSFHERVSAILQCTIDARRIAQQV